MKIRTIEELEDLLTQDLSWRKKELLEIRIMVRNESLHTKIITRAGIALLCAHFEGFIKLASNYYVAYIATQKISLNELKSNFWALQTKNNFKNVKNTEKITVYAELIDKICELNSINFKLNYNPQNPYISTESNPSSAILDNILKSIGIDSEIFETKKHYIDYSLLSKRHSVVHGEKYDVSTEEFDTIYSIILQLLDEYLNLIVYSAENEVYKKNK